MPVTLSTLFTFPQDVWDALSIEGVDLRNDDANRASGQMIQTTSDTPVGSTTMAVTALPVALLAGAQLTFSEAGMEVPVTVALQAAASVGTTSLSIRQVVVSAGVNIFVATVTDIPAGSQARDSGVNAATGARLLVACRKGTSEVKLFCNKRYDDSVLVNCGTVLDWATCIAARFLCTRRAQGCPKSLQKEYETVEKRMMMVQCGQLDLEDCGTRGVDWPAVCNITVNPAYDVVRARVQPSISEQTPTVYGQFIDWNSAAFLEW